MKTISQDKIKQLLKEDYKYLNTIYPNDRILGVFTYGLVNYGFAKDESDIKVKMYYLPSFEEMCTNLKLIDEELFYNNHTINVKDIRLILDNILNQEETAMECFFSKNYIITPKFKKVFEENIIEKREDIFHCNPRLRVLNSVERAFSSLSLYEKTQNSEYLFDVCRRRLSTDLYLSGTKVEDCLTLKKDYHINYLWSIKNNIIMPNLEEVKQDLIRMENAADGAIVHPEQEQLVKECITEIMKIALTKTVRKEDLLAVLTETEKNAFKVILAKLTDGEGAVSISQLTNESGFSRPVFKSVLQKLKDMEIAEINNMGVKGTYINIIDGAFLDIDSFIDLY